MKNKGKLFLFCGKMGAGKSTKAQSLCAEVRGILLSEDNWLATHYPNQINTFDDYLKYSQQIKPFVQALVINMLNTGVNVVMDFPANTQKQRAWLLSLSEQANTDHQLMYIDISDEQCLKHIAKRRSEQPERAKLDTEEVFKQVTQYFEPPSFEERLNIVTAK